MTQFEPLPEFITDLSEADPDFAEYYDPQDGGGYRLHPEVNPARRRIHDEHAPRFAELADKTRQAVADTERAKAIAGEREIDRLLDDLTADFTMPRGLKRGMLALLKEDLQPRCQLVEFNDIITTKITLKNGGHLNRWVVEGALTKPQYAAYLEHSPAYRARQGEGQFTKELESLR